MSMFLRNLMALQIIIKISYKVSEKNAKEGYEKWIKLQVHKVTLNVNKYIYFIASKAFSLMMKKKFITSP